ncbi:vacuolar cation/proton exchanger 2-like isoform X8 [Magnolia sinica]|uniref:vacuolar cation/proton exchanger 2-like isoform X8 n=1 Tax=Magnolia sinica TaxID=86752 RepID=UPI0026597BD7|nr:vacuolar cation/proton exchanger 2-like isoform X8 [Magnolia sinica]
MAMGTLEEMADDEFEVEILGSSSSPSARKMLTFETSHCSSIADVAHAWTPKRMRSRLQKNIYLVLINGKINVLLPFGPLAVLLHYLTGKHGHGWVFLFSLLGIAPLAERLGYATEQLAYYTGPTAVLYFTRSEVHVGRSELALSRFSSFVMLVAYAGYLFFQLKSHQSLYDPIVEEGDRREENSYDEDVPEITLWESIAWLAVLTVWVSVISGYLVDAIQGASDLWNMPVAFISVILLPIVGNAAEHASAIMFATKNKLDITLGVAIGSSTQISMFVIPFCVVVGWVMRQPMDLNFQLFETATLFITVLVVAFMLQQMIKDLQLERGWKRMAISLSIYTQTTRSMLEDGMSFCSFSLPRLCMKAGIAPSAFRGFEF